MVIYKMASNFGTALRHIKNGSRVTREKWAEEQKFYVLFIRDDVIMMDYDEWIPTQEDILASDWYIAF